MTIVMITLKLIKTTQQLMIQFVTLTYNKQSTNHKEWENKILIYDNNMYIQKLIYDMLGCSKAATKFLFLECI